MAAESLIFKNSNPTGNFYTMKIQLLLPCYCGSLSPQHSAPWLVADGGDTLKLWRVTAYILSKQSHTVNQVWFPSLGVGWGTNSSST